MSLIKDYCKDTLIINLYDHHDGRKYFLRIEPFLLIKNISDKITEINQLLWFYPNNKKEKINLGKKLYLTELLYENQKLSIRNNATSYNLTDEKSNSFFPINFYHKKYILSDEKNKNLIIDLFISNEIKKIIDLIIYIEKYDHIIYFDFDIDIFEKENIKSFDVEIPIKTEKNYKINLNNQNVFFIKKIIDEYFSFNNYNFNRINNNINIKNINEKILKYLNQLENTKIYSLMPLSTMPLSTENLFLKSLKISNNLFDKNNFQKNDDSLIKNFDEFSNFIEYNLLFEEKYLEKDVLSSLIYYENFLKKINNNKKINYLIINKSVLKISDFSIDLPLLKEMNNQNSDYKEISFLLFKYLFKMFDQINIYKHISNTNQIKNDLISFFIENFDNNKIKSYILKEST